MPKYLLEASYSKEGAQGIRKAGGSARRTAVKELVEKAGGKLEAFYFAFGKSDAVLIVDLPDHSTALSLSIAVNSTGAVGLRTTVLVTPEEMDAAAKKSVDYRPPGS